MMAREWKKQEELRKALANKWDEYQRRDQETQQRIEQTTTEQRTQRVERVSVKNTEQRSSNNLLKKQFVRFPREEAAAAMGVDLDSFASSAAPLRFDVEHVEREDLGHHHHGFGVGAGGGEEMDGTEAFSVDSM